MDVVDAALERVSKEIKDLTEAVQQLKATSNPPNTLPVMKELVAAVKEQGENTSESRKQIEAIRVQINEYRTNTLTYAEAVAVPRAQPKTCMDRSI